MIEAPQMLEDGPTNPFRADLASFEPNGLFHLGGKARKLFGADRSTLRRGTQSSNNLVAIERLTRSGSFDDDQRHFLHPLERGEPVRALSAAAATADGSAVVCRARVDDSRVVGEADRAMHTCDGTRSGPGQRVGQMSEMRHSV